MKVPFAFRLSKRFDCGACITLHRCRQLCNAVEKGLVRTNIWMQSAEEFQLEINQTFFMVIDLTTGALDRGNWGVSSPLDSSE